MGTLTALTGLLALVGPSVEAINQIRHLAGVALKAGEITDAEYDKFDADARTRMSTGDEWKTDAQLAK